MKGQRRMISRPIRGRDRIREANKKETRFYQIYMCIFETFDICNFSQLFHVDPEDSADYAVRWLGADTRLGDMSSSGSGAII